MSLGGLFHAAEAGTYAARHLVLQGNLALHTSLLGKASHAHHHRLRTAGRDHVKLLVLQHRVIGYETHLAGRAILGSDAYLSYLGKLIQLQQVGSLAGTQQEGYLCTKLLDEFSEVEQRSHTYATTHEEILLALLCRHSETIAQRQHTVERIASLKLSELAGSVAHHGNEQPELVGFSIHEIDGDRTAKHGGRRIIYLYFYELSRQDFRQRLLVGKLNQYVLIAECFYRNHLKV